MAFQAIAVRQYKSFTVSGEDGSISVALDAAVVAGSTLAVVGVSVVSAAQNNTVLLNSVADGVNTWGTPTNVRAAGSYTPNAFGAVAENAAAGGRCQQWCCGGGGQADIPVSGRRGSRARDVLGRLFAELPSNAHRRSSLVTTWPDP